MTEVGLQSKEDKHQITIHGHGNEILMLALFTIVSQVEMTRHRNLVFSSNSISQNKEPNDMAQLVCCGPGLGVPFLCVCIECR